MHTNQRDLPARFLLAGFCGTLERAEFVEFRQNFADFGCFDEILRVAPLWTALDWWCGLEARCPHRLEACVPVWPVDKHASVTASGSKTPAQPPARKKSCKSGLSASKKDIQPLPMETTRQLYSVFTQRVESRFLSVMQTSVGPVATRETKDNTL